MKALSPDLEYNRIVDQNKHAKRTAALRAAGLPVPAADLPPKRWAELTEDEYEEKWFHEATE
jgi:hypothetical protein